jgi:hypothetical protein
VFCAKENWRIIKEQSMDKYFFSISSMFKEVKIILNDLISIFDTCGIVHEIKYDGGCLVFSTFQLF